VKTGEAHATIAAGIERAEELTTGNCFSVTAHADITNEQAELHGLSGQADTEARGVRVRLGPYPALITRELR